MKWSSETYKTNSAFKRVSFLCHKNDFLKRLKMGGPFLSGAIKYLSSENFKFTKEVAFQQYGFLKKFQNSKILLIGAGPSFTDSTNIDGYDYVWSCNHFYKNSRLNRTSIDLVTLGNENDLFDKKLLNYLDNNNTVVCFENKYTKTEEMGKFKRLYPDSVFWAFTRYHSRIGSIPRLACIAIAAGASEIGFVGMDGYVNKSMQLKFTNSTFETTKAPNGTVENNSTEEEIFSIYEEQYLSMWDYLLHDIGKDVKFKNLGHGHPCNLSTKVLTEKLGENYQEYLWNINKRT